MPLFFNDAVDDPLAHDFCDSFAGGMVSNVRSNRLESNQAALLVNCDINEDGRVKTRRGCAALGSAFANKVQGLVWYDTATFEYLVVVARSVTYRYTGGAWAAWSGYVPSSATSLVNIASHLDTLFFVDGGSHVWSWDGTTLTDLGTGAGNQPPNNASIIVSFTNRLFVSGIPTDPTAIHLSSIGATPTWDTTNNVIRVGYGENDAITNLTPWDGFNLLVFKRNSVWVVDATPTTTIADFEIQILHRSIGCVGPRAACQVGQDVWFLSDSGVHSVRRTIVGSNKEVTTPISLPIDDIIQRIAWANASKSVAHFYNNRFMLSVPLDGATEPNYMLVYDTQQQAWSGYWTGLACTQMATSQDGGELRLNFGRSDGYVARWLSIGGDTLNGTFEDIGSAIPTTILSRAMTFQEAVSPKSAFRLETEFHESFATAATVAVSVDQKDSTNIESAFDTTAGGLTLPLTLPFTLIGPSVKRRSWSLQQRLPVFREMQVQVSSLSNKLALRMITGQAFIETLKIEQ